jgi:TRAP-type C4-dicarboxylate transport system permease small subunit
VSVSLVRPAGGLILVKYRIKENLIEIISGAFLSVTILVVILNVILRYVFDTGIVWVEEVATGCFIWTVFIGSAAAYKYRKHIGIDMLLKLFPPKAQKIISILIDLLTASISLYIVYLSTVFIKASSEKTTPVLGISSSYLSSALFVGFLLIAFYALRFVVIGIRDFNDDTEKREETK